MTQSAAVHELIERAYRAVAAHDFGAAEKSFFEAHVLAPNDAVIAGDLGAAAMRTGGYTAAAPWLTRAAELAPENAATQAVAGLVLAKLGRAAEALLLLERCVSLDPARHDALEQLGALAVGAGDPVGALRWYDAALAVAPDSIAALIGAGNALSLINFHREAAVRLEQALKIDPGNAVVASCRLMSATYDPGLAPKDLADLHRRLAGIYRNVVRRRPLLRPLAERRVRVGYVSADFQNCVGASQLISLLRSHDRSRFEVACYVANAGLDQITERCRALADLWRPIHDLSDDAAADLVAADGIDVLVDFNGHAEGSRLGVFARRPAPVSVSMPGYAATTGLAEIDYRITDRISDPEDANQALYAERLVWLPEGHFSYEPLLDPPPIAPAPKRDGGTVVFGSFHNRRKYNDAVIALWAEILKRVPHAQLVLKDRQFDHAPARDHVLQAFAGWGVGSARLRLLGFVATQREHYRAYDNIDIALDPFPVNGTTTTLDALLMGVPVVALRGDRHVSRLAANILTRVGAAELIAESPIAYIELAVALAGDRDRRVRYRTQLRDCVLASPIIQARRVVGPLEDFYASVVNRVGP